MLYTFEFTEADLVRVTDYLDAQWQYPDRHHRYIWAVQRSLIDDRVYCQIECDEATAVWISLMVAP